MSYDFKACFWLSQPEPGMSSLSLTLQRVCVSLAVILSCVTANLSLALVPPPALIVAPAILLVLSLSLSLSPTFTPTFSAPQPALCPRGHLIALLSASDVQMPTPAVPTPSTLTLASLSYPHQCPLSFSLSALSLQVL
ncbi:hypothetical protein BJY52DRAFT_1192436 [Lactarius psammicola]|nr:hypothetical protein BJY52DRAFT_1192436 [Lactarius psammicola]